MQYVCPASWVIGYFLNSTVWVSSLLPLSTFKSPYPTIDLLTCPSTFLPAWIVLSISWLLFPIFPLVSFRIKLFYSLIFFSFYLFVFYSSLYFFFLLYSPSHWSIQDITTSTKICPKFLFHLWNVHNPFSLYSPSLIHIWYISYSWSWSYIPLDVPGKWLSGSRS